MITLKLYLYDSTKSDYRGTEYTQYLIQGSTNTEKLNNELDITNLTIQGEIQVGNSYKITEFDPETMFIIDLYEDDKFVSSLHRIVQIDYVSFPILSNQNYTQHAITLIEPSAIAQKRLVDNISVTYKLKDVNLETQTTYDTSMEMPITNNNQTPQQTDFGVNLSISGTTSTFSIKYGKYIDWQKPVNNIDSLVVLSNNDGTYKTNDYYNLMGSNFPSNQAKFILPKPKIMFGIEDVYEQIGYASLQWTIKDYDGSLSEPTTTSGDFISNSVLNTRVGSGEYQSGYTVAPYRRYLGENGTELAQHWLPEKIKTDGTVPKFIFKKYTGGTGAIDFSTNTLETSVFTLQDGHRYVIEIGLKDYDDALPTVYAKNIEYGGRYYGYRSSASKQVGEDLAQYVNFTNTLYNQNVAIGVTPKEHILSVYNNDVQYANNDRSNSEMFSYTTEGIAQLFVHSNPYSALTLIQKAILNSETYIKQNNIASNNINYVDSNGVRSFNCPFYIDDNYIQELSATQVIENFYNQKNLWEVLLEVGYYIHAIPEIKFGENEKFMITFNKLGETTEYTNNATKHTISNFKGIDDYLCATSSYITNMVQLGGKIEEYISPKTSNEQYLVYNDTVEIQTTKSIIELLEIKAILTTSTTPTGVSYSNMNLSVGVEYDITNFIYEKNVYNLLSISKQDVPNKGIALYYSLGNNKIEGGQYQLPQSSTSPYSDYAIKKVLWLSNPINQYSASFSTSPWKDICVNDFVFKVKYRTKDDVRQNNSRPDLRKYLLNSKFDRVPQHNQFNNQTDTLVDSQKFGNNMYGKLIRTGNTIFNITEWCNSLSELKHKGELYRISEDSNNLYYVSKVNHTFFVDHIISEVEYSKDYNQLSQVIGIPSEPRFYEISEQSSIRRDVAINQYILITNDDTKLVKSYNEKELGDFFIDYTGLVSIIDNQSTYSKYAITTFKGDKDIGINDVNFGENNHYKDIISPINAYSSGTTLTYEWDMVDNFGAGDSVAEVGTTDSSLVDKSYRSMKAVQYCDKYGKSTLMDFYIIKDISPTYSQIFNFPTSPVNTIGGLVDKKVSFSNRQTPYAVGETNLFNDGLILFKDCREAISVNLNIQALTDSDKFVISPYLFKDKKKKVRVVLLNQEVNKLTNGFIDKSTIIRPKNQNGTNMISSYFKYIAGDLSYSTKGVSPYDGNDTTLVYGIPIEDAHIVNQDQSLTYLNEVNANHFGNAQGQDVQGYERVKAIALVYDTDEEDLQSELSILYKSKFIIAMNVPNDMTKENAIKNWHIGSPKKSLFTNKQ